MGAQALIQGARIATAWLLATGKNMVIALSKMVATSAVFVAKWAWMGIQALFHAARMAAAWFIALGPIGWVIAAVVGLVVLIIANWDKVKKWTVKIWSAVWNWIKDIASKIKNWVSDKFGALKNTVNEKMSATWSIIRAIWSNILSYFKSIDLYESGKAIMQSAIDGLSAMKGKILGVVDNIVGAVRDFWPFSPAKRGPLSDIHRMDFKGPIRTSIEKAKSPLVRATTKLANGVKTAFNPDLSVNTSRISTGLRGLKKSSTAQVSSAVNAEVKVNNKQPAFINLSLGGHEYRTFVSDITEEQERELNIQNRFR